MNYMSKVKTKKVNKSKYLRTICKEDLLKCWEKINQVFSVQIGKYNKIIKHKGNLYITVRIKEHIEYIKFDLEG